MTNAKKKITIILLLTILIAIGVGIYFTNNKKHSDKISVAASYYPLYDFAKNIGGDKVEVTNITPAGSEPHGFEPSAKQLALAYQSDVFVYNGATMETWAENFLKDYKKISVKSSDNIDLIKLNKGNDLYDPHFWLDPVDAKIMVDNILNGLIKASPENEAYFTKNANLYKEKLTNLDESFKNNLSKCLTDTAITSHQAFDYLSKRYKINLVSISGVDPSVEPDASKLAEISDLVKSKGVKYIFFESLVSPKLANTIASETGAQTATLDPIGGVSDKDQEKGDDYVKIQQRNIESLKKAFECQ